MGQPSGDPHCLLRWQEVVGSFCLHFDHSGKCVFDLVQIMGVPACGHVATGIEGVGPRSNGRPSSDVYPPAGGRQGQILGRTRRDRHVEEA